MYKSLLFTFLIALTRAKQQIVLAEVVQSSVGLALLFTAAAILYLSSRTEVVQFEQIELTHPPTPIPVLKDAQGETSTSLPNSLKEASFDSEGQSPAQRKKRKRKAHRLSDRRRNNESESNEAEEVEQGSEL